MAAVRGRRAIVAATLLLLEAMATTQGLPYLSKERQGGVAAAVARCSREERACWARGELWAGGACHAPLEQGPCADAHWLLLDARAMPSGTCAPRPCPPTQLPSAGRCLEEAEAREMCWSGAVHLDALGRLRCGASPGWSAILKAHVRCQQPATRPSHYNFTTDDSYNNAIDAGYNNADYVIDNFIESDFNPTDSYTTSAPGSITDAEVDSDSGGYTTSNPLSDDNSATNTHTNIAVRNNSVEPKPGSPTYMFGPAAVVPGEPLQCPRGQGGDCVLFVVGSSGGATRPRWSLVALLTGALTGRHLTGVARW